MNNEYKDQLFKIYRGELFETPDLNVRDIDSLISDEDLRAIIILNNAEMCSLVNKRPINKDLVRKLFISNVNFYKLAKYRELSVPGSSILMTMASVVNYNIDKLYDELNVGRYNRIARSR